MSRATVRDGHRLTVHVSYLASGWVGCPQLGAGAGAVLAYIGRERGAIGIHRFWDAAANRRVHVFEDQLLSLEPAGEEP